jgi:hypothetical protein
MQGEEFELFRRDEVAVVVWVVVATRTAGSQAGVESALARACELGREATRR